MLGVLVSMLRCWMECDDALGRAGRFLRGCGIFAFAKGVFCS